LFIAADAVGIGQNNVYQVENFTSTMDSKFLASVAIAFVLVFGILAGANVASAQGNDTWYMGEGAVQDTYVTYEIAEYQTNNRIPYTMTIYFQEFDEQDNVWIAPTYVVSEGRVMEGTLRLSGTNLFPLGGSEYPSEMSQYVSGYASSILFLESYAPKSAPKSLSAIAWGNVAGTGAAPIGPAGKEDVTVQGGSFETTVISYSRGSILSKIWVADNFPYPVKALVYVDTTEPPAPVRYEFELTDQGEGQPEAPTGSEETPLPPLTRETVTGQYQVQLNWDPAEIQPDSTTDFNVSFYNSGNNPVVRVNYDFVVTDAGGNVVYDESSYTGETNSAVESVPFGDGGPVNVNVKITAISSVGTGAFIEEADFGLVVVPEFPVSAAIIAAVAVGFIVAMTRFRTSLSPFGGRNAL
jgi:hypothetical protein